MTKELIQKFAVTREKGYMYFVDGEGSIWRSKMGRVKKQEAQVVA